MQTCSLATLNGLPRLLEVVALTHWTVPRIAFSWSFSFFSCSLRTIGANEYLHFERARLYHQINGYEPHTDTVISRLRLMRTKTLQNSSQFVISLLLVRYHGCNNVWFVIKCNFNYLSDPPGVVHLAFWVSISNYLICSIWSKVFSNCFKFSFEELCLS